MTEETNLFTEISSGYRSLGENRFPEAHKHFTKALELDPNCEVAAFEIGRFYEKGVVVKRDYAKAFLHYRLATSLADAQERLAEMYELGLGTAADKEEAQKCREAACKQKEQDGKPPLTLAESIRKRIAEQQN